MGNGSANCGRLLGLARVSALLACVALFAPAAAESKKARDRDHDGLSDRYELKKSHTKIRKADSDHDRLKDGYEVRKSKTNPRRADTDRDGLSDFFELRRSRTNPRKRDTDRDGVNDGAELLLGRNPKKPDAPSALNTAPVGPFTVPDLPDPLPDVPDLLPPDTTITTGPTGTVANGTASFSFASTEANSTFECRLDSSAWSDCDSPQPYAGLQDGVHTFSVRATDESGNTDLTPAQRRWTVAIDHDDTTPPDTSITAGPSGSVTDHSASFSFASTESGSTFDCRLDGGAWTDCTSPKAYSGLADGSHTFAVRATDSVGNTDASPASRTWTVTTADTTAPNTTISSGPSGTVNTASASFSFTSTEMGSTFQCRLDAGAWGACTSPKAYSGLTDGSHTFDVRATDGAGNTDASPASRTWTIDTTPDDTTPPNTTISAGPSGTVTSASASFTFTSSETGSTFQCRLDAGAWGACTSPKAYSGLANGSHTFDVRATDGAGNTDASPASRTWTVNVTTTTGAKYPIGVWIQDPTRMRGGQPNAVNFKNVGVNTFFGLWDFPAEAAVARLQAAKDAGMKVIAGTDTEWIKSHPEFADTFQGYLLGDEPDLTPTSENPDTWKARGDAIRAADPSRDVYGNFGRSFCDYPGGGYSGDPNTDFPKYTEPLTIASCGMYSMTDTSSSSGMWDYGEGVDNMERWAPGKKVVGFVEASAPFEDGGRITATQLKQAAWEVVVHGADGLEYFCHDFQGGGFIEDGCLAQTGIPAAMTEVNNEIQGYADVLARPDVSGTTATGRVTTLTKSFDGSTYVFALSDGNSSTPNGFTGSSTIDVAGIDTGTATVVGEGRTLPVSGGSFTDTFSGYQHHVYKIVGGAGPDPSPTPTPTPTPTPDPDPDPDPTGFPTSATTGWQHTGVTLKTVKVGDSGPGWSAENVGGGGTFYVRTAGTVIDGLDIPMCVKIMANNVTIKRSRISCASYYTINTSDPPTSYKNLTLTDVEIDGKNATNEPGIAVMATQGATYTRIDVHGFGSSGPRLASNTTVQDSYIHGFVCSPPDHSAGMTANDGGTNINILRNNVDISTGKDGCASTAIGIDQDFGTYDGVLIKGNLVNGGAYCMYTAQNQGSKNIHVEDNHFGRKYYSSCGGFGPVAQVASGNGNTFTGNVWDDTGMPVNG